MRLQKERADLLTRSKHVLAGALLATLAAVPGVLNAQTATISGTLSGFDVVNESGQDAHGFEIQLEGAQPADLYYTVYGQRYGTPTVATYATGVYVRYQSPYNPSTGQYVQSTPQHTPGATFGWQDCYQGGVNYNASGCEHFGQTMRAIPAGRTVIVTGRWMVDDTNNPGNLVALNPPAAIPFATWFVSVPTTFAAPPAVVAEIEAPEPPPTPEKYGDAQWLKIYSQQLPSDVTADQLTSDDTAVVPESASQQEVAWEILQASPPTNGNGKNTSSVKSQGNLAITSRSAVRRYELYKFTGSYDATTHKALCADTTCTTPATTELGDALGAQNSATNVIADSLAVTKTGSGSIADSTAKISCGNTCAMFAPSGTVVTLTATPSGTAFGGWTGACSGTQLSCSVTVSGQVAVGAAFLNQYTLSIGHSNSGTVTGTPSGNDRAINCGGTCSARFTDGTAVTLTATPPAGKQFVNWSGGCSGTAPICSLTISKNTSVQAVFSK